MERRMTTVEVELDVFSGMPNPAWTLSKEQATEFLAKLAELQETEPKSRFSGLGYRGLIIRTQQGLDRELHIQNGFLEVGGGFFLDQGRSLERWLVGTGRKFVDKNVLEVVEADLEN